MVNIIVIVVVIESGRWQRVVVVVINWLCVYRHLVVVVVGRDSVVSCCSDNIDIRVIIIVVVNILCHSGQVYISCTSIAHGISVYARRLSNVAVIVIFALNWIIGWVVHINE